MADGSDAQLCQILSRQLRERTAIYVIVAEAAEIGLKSRIARPQPLAYLLLRPALEDGARRRRSIRAIGTLTRVCMGACRV